MLKSIIFFFSFITVFVANAQTIQGIVYEGRLASPLIGATIELLDDRTGTVSDMSGRFSIRTDHLPCNLKVSFIGFISEHITVTTTTDTLEIFLKTATADVFNEQEKLDKFYKAGWELGYTGDIQYAPVGIQSNYSIQSIGKTHIDANINANYYTDLRNNWGTDLGIGKEIQYSKKFLPFYVQLNYLKFDYESDSIDLSNMSVKFNHRIDHSWLINYGAARISDNERTSNGAITGVTWVPYGIYILDQIISGVNINYTFSNHFNQIDAGTFHNIRFGNTYGKLTFKYSRLNSNDFFRVGLLFTIHSTRYYCCYSLSPAFHGVNTME